MFPLFGYLISYIINGIYNEISNNIEDDNSISELLNGYVILCCLPATAVSAAVLASNSNGNEIAAALNCTLSNLIGIFITPYLILFILGSKGDINEIELFISLILRLVVPIMVAQIIKYVVGFKKCNKLVKKYRKVLKKINELALLYMVFCALSESFYEGIDTNVVDIIIIVILIVFTHIFFIIFVWYFSGSLRCVVNPNKSIFMAFTIYDRIGILYTATSKTIAFGIPLIETMYSGNDNVGLYMIGILLYKPTQLIIGSILVQPLYNLAIKEAKELTGNKANMTDISNCKSNIFSETPTNYAALTPYNMDKSKQKLTIDIAD